DARLWDFSDDAFIPHQIAGDDDDAITAVLIVPPGIEVDERPLAINLRDDCALGRHERILEVIAADPAEREGSRQRWSEYKRLGYALTKHDM
ncbi:MAG: DNA polymerase III subunit chi, partial [Dokdonella sp.]